MERSTKTLQHGDKVTTLGYSFVIDMVLYQDFFDEYGFDCEFIDTKGNYHHWKQEQDNGNAYRWNGKDWGIV